jgi:hypothetical protein
MGCARRAEGASSSAAAEASKLQQQQQQHQQQASIQGEGESKNTKNGNKTPQSLMSILVDCYFFHLWYLGCFCIGCVCEENDTEK